MRFLAGRRRAVLRPDGRQSSPGVGRGSRQIDDLGHVHHGRMDPGLLRLDGRRLAWLSARAARRVSNHGAQEPECEERNVHAGLHMAEPARRTHNRAAE